MPHPDALHWNDRYVNKTAQRRPSSPRHLVISHLNLLTQHGLVLDVACGLTPTGLHLAEQGQRVIALDISIAALRLSQPQVKKDALPLSFAIIDMTNPWLTDAYFDGILNFYFLSRSLWATYRKSLKPGGLLFFETFLRAENMNQEHYLNSNELRNAFYGWEIIHYAEPLRSVSSNNDKRKTRRVAQLVARKPL